MTEADTCRKFVVPRLQKAGWDNDPHSIAEQRYFTAGRIVSHGPTARRRTGKRADYLLRYTRDLPLAVVEAKAAYKHPADGLQQAKDYASTLGLSFAYATNGTGIVEFDFLTGHERQLAEYPTPTDLWARYRQGHQLNDPAAADRLLTPFNLTTSQLLTTGLDAPTCRNIVLVRLVNSMVEFKQIIGRGTRVRDDYGKLTFNILDYTGAATRNFADTAFDGDPAFATQEEIDECGKVKQTEVITPEEPESPEPTDGTLADRHQLSTHEDHQLSHRKYYYDGGSVEIAAELVHELDADGKQLRVVKLTDYTAEKVRTLCTGLEDLRARWADATQRAEIIEQLAERGVDFQTVSAQAGKPDADPFDLLCHLAFNAPVLTRRQRADRVMKQQAAFFAYYAPEAREILSDLLEKYAADGELQFTLPDVLKVPPISQRGNVTEIARHFGGFEQLGNAVQELQTLLYAK